MEAIITLIIIFFVIVPLIKGKKVGNTKKSVAATRRPERINNTNKNIKNIPNKPPTRPVSTPSVKRSNTLKAEVNHAMLLEDRNNDWLARQLRDEHKAFKDTKDMFDLKIEHSSHCDARYIQQFHHNNCSAGGIDTASGK